MTSIPLTIRGTGSYLPRERLTSGEVDARMGWAPGRCRARYGIDVRHVAGPARAHPSRPRGPRRARSRWRASRRRIST
jgi:hypothetical protein